MKDLKQLEEIYIIYSRCTNIPYVYQHPDTFDDLFLVYPDKASADAKVSEMAEQKIPVVNAVCKKQQYDAFFTGMYYAGADGLLMTKDGEERLYPLGGLTDAPDFEKLPNRVYAVHNPSLQVSLAYFAQEARRPAPMEEKPNLKEMEEEVMANVLKGTYLLPQKPQTASQIVDGKRKIELMSIRDKNGNLYQPMFTDAIELAKFTRGGQVACFVIPFAETAKMNNPQLKGFVINPMGSNLILHRDQKNRFRMQL